MKAVCLGLWVFIALANAVGFLAARHDKQVAIARNGRKDVGSRIPERIFLLISFLGGWPGALAGFVVLRHKTTKRGFLTVFLILGGMGTFVLWGWLAVFGCLPSPSGPVNP